MPTEKNKHGCEMSTGMVCATCGEVNPDECIIAGMDPSLLDPTKAVGAVTPAVQCDPDEGVCEACQ